MQASSTPFLRRAVRGAACPESARSQGNFSCTAENEPEDKPEDGSDVEEEEEQEEYDSEETGTDESGSDTEEQ